MNDESLALARKASSIEGIGLFARKAFSPDETVFHVVVGDPAQPILSMNHSCQPNCRSHRAVVYAMRPIEPGEELTIDYRRLTFPVRRMTFDCRCGSPDCGGRIEAGHGV